MRKPWCLPFVLVVVMLPAEGFLLANSNHPPTPAEFVDLREVSDPQISPDGKQIAFVVTEPADPAQPDKPRDSDVWMVASDGKTPRASMLSATRAKLRRDGLPTAGGSRFFQTAEDRQLR